MGLEKQIKGYQKQIVLLLWGRWTLASTAWYLFLWGIGVVLAKIFFAIPTLHLFWPAVLIAISAQICLIVAFRHQPDSKIIRAMLDLKNRNGGLVMADAEVDLNGWNYTPPNEADLKFHGKPSKAGKTALLGLLFLTICFVIPKKAVTFTNNKIDISRQASEIEDKIETLEDLKVIEDLEADMFREELADVMNESQGDKPERTFDAIDSLQQSLNSEADKAAEDIQDAMKELAKTEAMAKALNESADKLSPEALAEAMKKLSEMKDAACEKMQQAACMNNELCEAMASQNLSPEMLEQLSKELNECNMEAGELLQKLIDAELIDGQCGNCENGLSEEDIEAIKAILAEGDCEGVAKAFGACKGGISRGPGHAAMAWKDPSDKSDVKFKAQQIDANAANIKQAELVGMSLGAPTDLKAGPQSGGGLKTKGSGGTSYGKRKLLPKHKNSVQNFFQPKGKK